MKFKSMLLFLLAFSVFTACNKDDDNVVIVENEKTQKEKVSDFFQAVNSRNVATLEELVTVDYIQHNPFIPTGRDAFISLLPVLEQNGTTVENIRMFEDGKFVIIHNFWTNAAPFGADTVVTFDILRFDDNGKIAEHWDALMPNTPPNPSGRTLIDGATVITDLAATESNKAIASTIFNTIINGTQQDVGAVVTNNFLSDYLQHSPNVADGIPAVFAAFAAEGWDYDVNHRVFGEGNFVLSVSEGTVQGVHSVFYDLLRFENGKVAEHWDVIQEIPTEGLAHNNGMFGF